MNKRNIKNLLMGTTLLISTTASAQFGDFLKNASKQLQEKIQEVAKPDTEKAVESKPESKPDVTAVSSPAPSNPAAPAAAPAAANEAAGDVRSKWLNDPYPDIPNEVTDEDIAKMTADSINKTFDFLKSPSMAKAYKACQDKEESRIGSKVAELKKAAGNATTTAERNTLQEQAAEIEKIKAKIAPTTCLLRTVRRATVELKLEYFGVQPKYGPQKANDEQFTVVQLFKVAKALETKQFTEKFNTDLSEEISMNYNEWIEKYLVKVFKESSQELKKYSNSLKQHEQLDGGADFAVGRRTAFYDQVIQSIINLILNEKIKP